MPNAAEQGATSQEQRLLITLERLLQIEATQVQPALHAAAQLLAEAIRADKVDVFLHDPSIDTMVAVGTSQTEMGYHQRSIGMDRLPVANRGRVVDVFVTGTTYHSGRSDQDPAELVGVKEGLGVKSQIIVPLVADNERRGVLAVASAQADHFTVSDVQFLEAVSYWVALVLHRAELVERITKDAADQAKRATADELITILAHDLGNYLTPLIGRIFILRSRAEREGRTNDVHDAMAIANTLERLRRLITALLDANRLEHGIFVLDLQPVDIVKLIQQTADMLRPPTGEIRVNAPDELLLEGDPDRLQQVLENLLTNAIKHANSQSIVIDVTTEQRDDGAWAVIAVQDAGPGIPPDVLPHLFTRFASGMKSRGLGLGLYLARGITEAHNGTLTAESTPGSGTTFRIVIPLQSPTYLPTTR